MEVYKLFLGIYYLADLFRATNEASIGPPDYSSIWLPLSAQSQVRAGVTVNHELDETPLLVDVHVKVLDGENEGFIFPAVGGIPRDDDMNETYGGVTYLYNNVSIMASAPLRSNDFFVGAAVYTGDGVHYTGPNMQTSFDVMVRFRAWLNSTLPPVDFQEKGIRVQCSTNNDEVYIERYHNFGSYPGHVIVRTILSDGAFSGWISDYVGSSYLTFDQYNDARRSSNVVSAFNDQSIRAWLSSDDDDFVYDSGDGFSFTAQAEKGMLEMYAWKAKSLVPWITHNTELAPSSPADKFQLPLNIGDRNIDDMFIQIWAESDTGVNDGYRFPGDGTLSFIRSFNDVTCSYGGLVYGYSADQIRLWIPTTVANGGMICLASYYGHGINTTMETEGKIRMSVWTTDTAVAYNTIETIEDVCYHTHLLTP